MSKILRGGRIGSLRKDVSQFTSSLKDDVKLLDAVVDINKAHVIMLTEQGIIKTSVCTTLLEALSKCSKLKLDADSEDVHMAVEEAVIKEVGWEKGGNLHIAKSRNDQVATAIRVTLRKSLISLMFSVLKMLKSLIETATKHTKTIILSYTHLQPAQPVTFAHYLISHIDTLERDLQKLQETYNRVNLCPMGACALATTSFPINRERTADLLGFNGLIENSIDAVGSRDFILETNAVATIVAINLSRLAEDLIVWSSPDFGVIELPDEFASTSSIMPQKKNPEVLEIIRARASNVLGDFVAVAAAVKSLPSTYNLDFQEITPKLWAAVGAVNSALGIFIELIPNLKVKSGISSKALTSFSAATELANMLVRKHNVPFRLAHKTVGALVKELMESKKTLLDVTSNMLKKIAKDTVGMNLTVKTGDIIDSIDLLKIVKTYTVTGGPAPTEVKKALVIRQKRVVHAKANVSKLKMQVQEASKKLDSTVESYFNINSHENATFKNHKLQVE